MSKAQGSLTKTGASGNIYELQFTTNALCVLEDELGKPLAQLGDYFGDGTDMSVSQIRLLTRIALISQTPEITPAQAGDVLDDLGGLAVGAEIIMEAFQLAFSDEEGVEEAGKVKAAS